MNKIIADKKLRGRYSKLDLKKLLFFDYPSTSSQDMVLTRNTDTSHDINYPNKRYKYLRNITDGSASIIYEGYDKLNDKKVIIKKIKKNECWRKELEILELIKHKTSDRILKIVDYYESQRRSYIVTEFFEGLDLFEHVELNSPYTEYKWLQLLKEMASCIKECHDNNVIHLDIKCENFMVKTKHLFENDKFTGKIVLIDFGHADNFGINVLKKGYNYGTTYYLCPEGYHEGISSSKSDIWSFGVCMSLILTGDFPYLGSSREYYKNCGIENIKLNKRISNDSYAVLKKCLKPYPSDRPSINEVIDDISALLYRK